MNRKPVAKTSAATKRRKSVFAENIYLKMGVDEIANICERVVIMHTTGVYMPPAAKPRVCQNKNKRKTAPSNVTSHNNNKHKTTFGKGRVGVSCEYYGIKNCTCCRPDSPTGMILQPIPASVFNFDDINDFTSDDDDVVIVDSFPNRTVRPMVTIDIDDEPCTSTSVHDLDVFDISDDPERGESNGSSLIIENVSTAEVDQQEVLDYVNLVTNDLDESNLEMREYEEQLMKIIEAELEEAKNKPIQPSSSTSAVNIPVLNPLSEQLNTANKENISSTNPSSIKKEIISDAIEINYSPAKKAPVADNTTNKLECPICFENLRGKEIMSTICGHLFCAPCIKHSIKQYKHCPNCRKKLTLKSIHPIFL